MTQCEVRNNMAYASKMQLEVLRCALWAQQAQPNIIFHWKFRERAAQNPKMTTYLHQGVKAKMCEATQFLNTVGTQDIAARAKVELACDSIRTQGQSVIIRLEISDNALHDVSEGDCSIVHSLMAMAGQWSAFIMRTTPFPADLLNKIHPCHQVLISTKPH